MNIEVNGKFIAADTTLTTPHDGTVSITPPLNEDYWLARVPVSETQAVVCFPKFFTIGIGFQHEEDWNTNLPYTTDAKSIYEHISHNKGDDSIPDAVCIAAIEALREFAAQRIASERQPR